MTKEKACLKAAASASVGEFLACPTDLTLVSPTVTRAHDLK